MRKMPVVLTLSAVCIAILFAQEMAGTPDVAPDTPVVPQPVDVPIANLVEEPQPVTVEIAPVIEAEKEETQKSVEIAMVEQVDVGAEIRGDLISLSLKDVELQDVVRLFSRLSNANIIIPDMLDEENPKRVDVNLDNVEWKPALQAILDTHGLELVEKIPGSEVYSIRPRPVDAPEPMQIKVFKLNYASVDEVAKMVAELVKKDGGQISTYPARNSIVAQGTAKLLNNLEEIVASVDLPREQVFIEAKFLELNDSASEQLGVDWSVLGGYNVGLQSISGSYSSTDTRTRNSKTYFDAAGRQYELLDGEAPDVDWIPKPWVDDPSGDGDYIFDNGIEYDARTGNDSSLIRMLGLTPTTENLDSTVVGKTLGATLNAEDFNLVLAALRSVDGAKVVSNPKIIVANEETAKILIGEREPNIRQSTLTVENAAPVTTYALDPDQPYFEYGVRLEVTPTVNTADNISVNIEPTLSSKVGDKGAGANSYPVTAEKTITTVFALKDGQTAAIGGLTQTDQRNIERKVPLLGDLPLLKKIFSYSSTQDEQTETIIFVTVGLANPDHIDMETGLPEDSSLAMRHRAADETDRALKREELAIFQTMEAERLQERLNVLRAAEEARLAKRAEKNMQMMQTEQVEVEEPEVQVEVSPSMGQGE